MAVLPTPKWGPKDPFDYNYPSTKKETVSTPNPFSLLNPFFDSWTIGFNDQFKLLEQLRSHTREMGSVYPPYNIKQIDPSNYEIELAVAGFTREDIDVELKNYLLTVKGSKKNAEETYVHKGLATRDFEHSWALADDVLVKGALLEDGILRIMLEREIPESEKPIKIKIK